MYRKIHAVTLTNLFHFENFVGSITVGTVLKEKAAWVFRRSLSSSAGSIGIAGCSGHSSLG